MSIRSSLAELSAGADKTFEAYTYVNVFSKKLYQITINLTNFDINNQVLTNAGISTFDASVNAFII